MAISFRDCPLCMYSMQILRFKPRLKFLFPICLNEFNYLTFKAAWESTYFSTRQNAAFIHPNCSLQKIAYSRSHLPNNFAKTTTRASHAPKSTVFLRSAAANHLSRRITSRTFPEPYNVHFPKRESCILNHEGNVFRSTRGGKPPNTPPNPPFPSPLRPSTTPLEGYRPMHFQSSTAGKFRPSAASVI